MHKFAVEMIDEAFESRFPRDINEVLGDVVVRSIGRVLGRELFDSAIDLDEIAEGVVSEEFDALSEENRVLIDGVIVESITDRVKDMLRDEVKSTLRAMTRKVTT